MLRLPKRIVAAMALNTLMLLAPSMHAQQPAEEIMAMNEPLPRDWLAPAYPPAAIAAKVEGKVEVEFVVDEKGQIVDPHVLKPDEVNPILGEAVLAQAAKWVFAPASDGTKPIARSLIVPVSFYLKGRGGKPSVSLPLQPELSPEKSARAFAQRDPSYPEHLMPRKLPGTMEVDLLISAEGEVADATVLFASDAEFVAEGLRAVQQWKFEPGEQGRLKVATPKKAALEFFLLGEETKREDVLKAHGISGWETVGLDAPPLAHQLHAPVYPRARFVAGEAGEAEVEFEVGEDGLTHHVNVLHASAPEFGATLAAAVRSWRFRAPSKEGQRAKVALRAKHTFAIDTAAPEFRLQAALQAGIAGAGGLDQRLRPLWRIPPVYPPELMEEKVAGTATVEFIIDREGRCRFPRVVSATHEALGWAAMAAVNQWVFAPPTRKGEPTDVRVSVPLEFSPSET